MWLNLMQQGGPEVYTISPMFPLWVPCLADDRITYKETMVPRPQIGNVPIHESTTITQYLQGPKTPSGLPPVVAVVVSPDADALRVALQWPAALQGFFPTGGFGDLLMLAAQDRMNIIARRSTSDLAAALQDARDNAGLYVTQGSTSQAFLWFLPLVATDGLDTALKRGVDQFNLANVSTWEGARRSKSWCQALEEHVEVTRVWGPIGLFWALLLEQLEDRRRYTWCEDCGRMSQGKKGKRHCSREDDPLCYARRRARDKRRERAPKPTS
jgi:hypothetical protein